jgi:hypothetical protein
MISHVPSFHVARYEAFENVGHHALGLMHESERAS